MKKLNLENFYNNILEARIQLEEIEKRIKGGKMLSESELQIMLAHAYHHINFAWNAKRVTDKKYGDMTDSEFNQWGSFPRNFKLPKLIERCEVKRNRKANKRLNKTF